MRKVQAGLLCRTNQGVHSDVGLCTVIVMGNTATLGSSGASEPFQKTSDLSPFAEAEGLKSTGWIEVEN